MCLRWGAAALFANGRSCCSSCRSPARKYSQVSSGGHSDESTQHLHAVWPDVNTAVAGHADEGTDCLHKLWPDVNLDHTCMAWLAQAPCPRQHVHTRVCMQETRIVTGSATDVIGVNLGEATRMVVLKDSPCSASYIIGTFLQIEHHEQHEKWCHDLI